jgi:hypothetical protein
LRGTFNAATAAAIAAVNARLPGTDETETQATMTISMIPRERCEFSAIVDRPPLRLPGEARLVFWTIVNYEVWDISRPMAAPSASGADRRAAASRRSELELA